MIEIIAVVVTICAIWVSWLSKHYAEKAFSLSLFDKRYKLYYEFKTLITNFAKIEKKTLPEFLRETKFLLWEAQYIFGEDVCKLFSQIKQHISKTILYFGIPDEIKAGRQSEDMEVIRKLKVEHYDALQSLLDVLLSDDESLNLNFYFHKYLSDGDFKKPLAVPFLQICRKV